MNPLDEQGYRCIFVSHRPGAEHASTNKFQWRTTLYNNYLFEDKVLSNTLALVTSPVHEDEGQQVDRIEPNSSLDLELQIPGNRGREIGRSGDDRDTEFHEPSGGSTSNCRFSGGHLRVPTCRTKTSETFNLDWMNQLFLDVWRKAENCT